MNFFVSSFLFSYSSCVKPSQKIALLWVEIVKEYPSFDNFLSSLSEKDIKNEFEKYMREQLCQTCNGDRLKKEVLAITINNESISKITSNSVKTLIQWNEKLEQVLNVREKQIAKLITKEIIIIMTTNINFKNFILKPFLNFNLVIQSPLIHYIIISEYNLSKGIL